MKETILTNARLVLPADLGQHEPELVPLPGVVGVGVQVLPVLPGGLGEPAQAGQRVGGGGRQPVGRRVERAGGLEAGEGVGRPAEPEVRAAQVEQGGRVPGHQPQRLLVAPDRLGQLTPG